LATVAAKPRGDVAPRPKSVAGESPSPYAAPLLGALKETAADVGWVAWTDGNAQIVLARPDGCPIDPANIAEFPEPPPEPTVVEPDTPDGAWTLWCRSRGILSSLIVPLLVNGRPRGTVGLASSSAGALGMDDLGRLRPVCYLMGTMRDYEARLASLQGLFDEVNRALERALAIDKAMRVPPTYRSLARAVAASLDVSYCQIAVRDVNDCLTLVGSGGRRPPKRSTPSGSWPLSQLARCAEAMREGRGVVVHYDRPERVGELEREAFLSSATRSVIILPFVAGPRIQGVLLVAEERESRCPPAGVERVAMLELVASRLGDVLALSRALERERLMVRRRQRQIAFERQRLAREVHDEVGQSLTAILVRLRHNLMTDEPAGLDELRALERMAQDAMNGARAVAYGIRQLGYRTDPLEEAHRYADTVLRAARCRLSWLDERTDVRVPLRVAKEVARVINESVTNIVRHARADAVRIHLAYPAGRIRVVIHDDGIGFTADQATPTSDGRGLGLLGNTERLARLDGIFDVCSSPDGGTSVLVEAPLARAMGR
jgi:signal transduction histidine kinase